MQVLGRANPYRIAASALLGTCAMLWAGPAFAKAVEAAVLEVYNPGAMSVGRDIAAAPARITVSGGQPSGWSSVGSSPVEGSVTISQAADIVGIPVDISSHFSAGDMPSGLPISGLRLTSGFGMRRHPILGGFRAHSGVDLAAPMGTPVRATSSGVISRASWNGGYGLFVSLENGKGVQTRYGHMSRLAVYAGQRVKKGDILGYVGSTGRSTGPHLHYEMRVNGRAVNPLGY